MSQNENLTYEQNLQQKAEQLARLKFLKAWDNLDEEEKSEETELALRQAEKALEWCAETARAMIGPNSANPRLTPCLKYWA